MFYKKYLKIKKNFEASVTLVTWTMTVFYKDAPFQDCSLMGEPQRPPSLKSVAIILQSWHSYTLPKEDPKNI